jgi:hypothetical protein
MDSTKRDEHGPLPRIHEREQIVKDAERAIARAIDEAVKGLTTAEGLRAVNTACADWIGGIARYAIRIERHGDAEKPGGVA